MTQPEQEPRVQDLEKTIRILRKKLQRSEKERNQIESDIETKEFLLKNVIEKLEASQENLKKQSQELKQALQEMQQMQLQLIQVEKMSALGQLVAGIAHEINNPLGFVYGNLDHAQEYTQCFLDLLMIYQKHCPLPNPEILAAMESMEFDFIKDDVNHVFQSMTAGAERIQAIVQSLRTFSRLDESEFKQIDLHESIESTLMVLQTRFRAQNWRSEIRIHKDYGHLPPFTCYAGQLNQVFMSILNNAIDAIEQKLSEEDYLGSQGLIFIESELQSNQTIEILIQDNGVGIAPELINRVFDPFFTTKAVGKGTGLGMAIAHQIITEKHGGTITCTSTLDQGTTFTIILPLLADTAVQ
ncbi:MAG: sensor histidine kinase [Spirulina sp. SIO3F2]|nr:sensor histidine kinase [Spirulina sp. SIO3F2]